ncbi:MAG: hypothetical protein ACPIOQ_34560 [Promethearchaeia archaeon]
MCSKQDAEYCVGAGMQGGDNKFYRQTPASADPYHYIRTGSYARILCHLGGVAGEVNCGRFDKADTSIKQWMPRLRATL